MGPRTAQVKHTFHLLASPIESRSGLGTDVELFEQLLSLL